MSRDPGPSSSRCRRSTALCCLAHAQVLLHAAQARRLTLCRSLRLLSPCRVVTFTNKAANEMKVRLCKMIGAETVDKLVMGTFHSYVPVESLNGVCPYVPPS